VKKINGGGYFRIPGDGQSTKASNSGKKYIHSVTACPTITVGDSVTWP
jgi:hypothetical protein